MCEIGWRVVGGLMSGVNSFDGSRFPSDRHTRPRSMIQVLVCSSALLVLHGLSSCARAWQSLCALNAAI